MGELDSVVLPLVDLVVDKTNDGKEEADGEDAAGHGEAAAVKGGVLRAEDLRTINTGSVGAHDDHSHGQSADFGILAGERHPGNVERVAEGAKSLGPDNAKVTGSLESGVVGEDAVQDVAEQMAGHASNDGLATDITVDKC